MQQRRGKIVSRLLPTALDRYLAAEPAMSPFPTAPFCRRILGIVAGLSSVEAANNAFTDRRRLRGIIRFNHSRCEARKFLAGKFSFRVELIGKSDDAN